MLHGHPLSRDLNRLTMVTMSIHPLVATGFRKVAYPLAITKGNDLPPGDNTLQTNTCHRDDASTLTRADRPPLGWNLEEVHHLKRQVQGNPDIGCIRYRTGLP